MTKDSVSEEPHTLIIQENTLIIQDDSEAETSPPNDQVLPMTTYDNANESLVQQPGIAIEGSTQPIDTPCFIYIDEQQDIPEAEITAEGDGSSRRRESAKKRARDESEGSSVQSADSPSQAKRRRKKSAQGKIPLHRGNDSDTFQIAEEVQLTLKHILEVIPQLQERELQLVEENLLDVQRSILVTRRSRT